MISTLTKLISYPLLELSVVGSVAGIGFDFGSIGASANAFLGINSGLWVDTSGDTGFLGLLSTDGMLVSSVYELGAQTSTFGASTAIVDNVVIATSTTTPIPEPNTLLLFAIGFVGILGLGYLKHRGKKASA